MIKWLKKVNNILCEMFTPSLMCPLNAMNYAPPKRAKKPRRKLRWNAEKGKYDELITINFDRMQQTGWHPDTGQPIFIKSIAP